MGFEMKEYVPKIDLESLFCSANLYYALLGSVHTKSEDKYFQEFEVNSCGILFTGRVGSGKRTAVEALAGTAGKSDYQLFEFSVMELLDSDIYDSRKNIKEYFEYLREIIEIGKEHGKGVFVFLDDICLFDDDVKAGMFFFKNLKKLLNNVKTPVIVVSTYDDVAANLPDFYRIGFQIINIDEANEYDRENMFNSRISDYLNEDVSCDYLVQSTKGFSKGEIETLINLIFMSIIGQKKEDEDIEDISELINKKLIDSYVSLIEKSRYVPAQPEIISAAYPYPVGGAFENGNMGADDSSLKTSKNNSVLSEDLLSGTMDINKMVSESKKPVNPLESLKQAPLGEI